MNIINYEFIRIAITLLIVVIIILIGIKNDNFTKIKLIITNFILLIISSIFWIFPFENYLIKFDNLNSIFKYYYPDNKIIKKYKYKNSVYILSGKNNLEPNEFIYFYKNNYWRIDDVWKKGQGVFFNNNDCSLLVIDNKYDNSFAIMGIYEHFDNKGLLISDSLKSKIHVYSHNSNVFTKEDLKITEIKYGKNSKEYKEMYKYYKQKDYIFVIINDKNKIMRDYTIFINSDKCMPFYNR